MVFCFEEFNFVCQTEEICIGNIRCGWENETLIDILVGSLVAGTSFLIILAFLVIFHKKICKRRSGTGSNRVTFVNADSIKS